MMKIRTLSVQHDSGVSSGQLLAGWGTYKLDENQRPKR